MLTKEQLVEKARTYLEDALNAECSTHTRYSSAMSAIQCLYLAGIAEEVDGLCVDIWEASRYNVNEWPNEEQVALVIDRAFVLLTGGESGDEQ